MGGLRALTPAITMWDTRTVTSVPAFFPCVLLELLSVLSLKTKTKLAAY